MSKKLSNSKSRRAAAPSVRDQLAAAVGAKLRAARAKIGMTRKHLAAASETSERYLAHLEGGIGNPSLHVLTALAAALDIPVAELLPLGGERDARFAKAAEILRRLPAKRLADFYTWNGGQNLDTGKGRRLTLVGLRGAGKSSLGKALAERLEMPFIEMTREVEQAYGADVGLLIELGGQAALRRQEALAWQAIVKKNPAAVISAPGGIVANDTLFADVLAASHTVWLEASPEDHMKRVMAQGDFRPMAGSRGAMADLKTILNARSGDYAKADSRLNTSAQDFDRTLGLLEDLARGLFAAGM